MFFIKFYCKKSTRFLGRNYFIPDIIISVCNDCLFEIIIVNKINWSDQNDKGCLLLLVREELNKLSLKIWKK